MYVKHREFETKCLQIICRWERMNLEFYPTFLHSSCYILIAFHHSHLCLPLFWLRFCFTLYIFGLLVMLMCRRFPVQTDCGNQGPTGTLQHPCSFVPSSDYGSVNIYSITGNRNLWNFLNLHYFIRVFVCVQCEFGFQRTVHRDIFL